MYKPKKTTIQVWLIILLIVAIIATFFLTFARLLGGPKSTFADQAYEEFGIFDIWWDCSIVDRDDYGRVLVSSGNIAQKSKPTEGQVVMSVDTGSQISTITGKSCIIIYSIFLTDKDKQKEKHLPDVYYYVAYNNDTKSDEFKQFLEDNNWGQDPSTTMESYVSFSYAEEQAKANDENYQRYWEYKEEGLDDIYNPLNHLLVKENYYIDSTNQVVIAFYIDTFDRTLNAVAVDCQDADNLVFIHRKFEYADLATQIESFKQEVGYNSCAVVYDADWQELAR